MVVCAVGANYAPLACESIPLCDWFSRWVNTVSPPAIGSNAGYILPPLLRLVLTLGIYCLPSCDWFSRLVYTASPPAIGSYAACRPSGTRRCAPTGEGRNVSRTRAAARCAPSRPPLDPTRSRSRSRCCLRER
eukprot:2078529-Pyramimonas_sp.AAC.1